jgi:hypothetical protein
MAEEMKPASSKEAPDPSRSYERSRPEDEPGMGRLNQEPATPTPEPDRSSDAVKNRRDPAPDEQQPDHSMHEEEPDGWDQAPTDIHNPRHKRHPRTEGRGGTP